MARLKTMTIKLPAALSANIVDYYGGADPLPTAIPDQQKRLTKIRVQVASLKATCACP